MARSTRQTDEFAKVRRGSDVREQFPKACDSEGWARRDSNPQLWRYEHHVLPLNYEPKHPRLRAYSGACATARTIKLRKTQVLLVVSRRSPLRRSLALLGFERSGSAGLSPSLRSGESKRNSVALAANVFAALFGRRPPVYGRKQTSRSKVLLGAAPVATLTPG